MFQQHIVFHVKWSRKNIYPNHPLSFVLFLTTDRWTLDRVKSKILCPGQFANHMFLPIENRAQGPELDCRNAKFRRGYYCVMLRSFMFDITHA